MLFATNNRRTTTRSSSSTVWLLVLLALVLVFATTNAAQPQLRRARNLQQDQASESNSNSTSSSGYTNNTVVGGTAASSGEFPFFALYNDRSCGGTLISPNRVLTAAHCVAGRNINSVNIGPSKLGEGKCVRVSCSYMHPDYDGSTFANDIAVLKLCEDVQGVTFVTLNTDVNVPVAGSQVQLIGFGQITAGSGTGVGSSTLQKVTYNAISDAECKASYGDFVEDGKHVCVQDTVGTGACFGDSGGPLLDTGGTIQYGLVSGADLCANGGPQDVYTDVAYYKDWINEQLTSTACDCNFGAFLLQLAGIRNWARDTTSAAFSRMGNFLG